MWTIPRSPKSIVELILVYKKLTTVLCTQTGSQISRSSVYSIVDRFLHNAQVKCFDELSQLKKECMCITVATISKLLVADGWIYDGCPKCNKKSDGEGSSFVCVGCGNKSASTSAKFRVDVRVGQPNESAIFTLWDRECYGLIKETAYEIKEKMIDKDGIFDARDITEELDRVLGKTLAFRFKQCLLAIAESDPTLLGSITPAKHILPLSHSQVDGIPFEDLSSIQLSSTRLGKKHIKTE
ncbi:hypothetical protein HKD37_04G011008 [Glycine soja]